MKALFSVSANDSGDTVLHARLSDLRNLGVPDHLGPFFSFIADEFPEIGRRAGQHHAAEFSTPCLQLGIGKPSVDLNVELFEDRRGRVLRRNKPDPLARLESWNE